MTNETNLKQKLRVLVQDIRAAADTYPSAKFTRIADEIAALDREITGAGKIETPDPVPNPFRSARESRNLTQTEAGDRIGVTKQMISQYETGARKPGQDAIQALAGAYGVVFEASRDGWTWRDDALNYAGE